MQMGSKRTMFEKTGRACGELAAQGPSLKAVRLIFRRLAKELAT